MKNQENNETIVNKKADALKTALKKIGLKPLFNTTFPKDKVYAVECLKCGEFWQQHHKSTHEKECLNPHKSSSIEEILTIIWKVNNT